MKIGIIGIGDIAKKAYLPVITRKKDLELVLCSRTEEKLKEVAKEYNLEYTTNINKLIEMKVEGVFVHSSTSSHYTIVKKLLENNIHVYVDKPISYSLEEARELTKLAKEKSLVLMVGFNRRNAPSIKKLSGKNNTVLLEKNRVNLPGEDRVYVYDDFIHVVDTIAYLLGEVRGISVHLGRRGEEIYNLVVNFYGKDNIGIGVMNRDSGMTEEKVEVFRSGEKIIVENVSDTIVYKDNVESRIKESDWIPVLEKRGFYNLIDDFITYIEKPDTFDLYDDALRTHEICEEILELIEAK